MADPDVDPNTVERYYEEDNNWTLRMRNRRNQIAKLRRDIEELSKESGVTADVFIDRKRREIAALEEESRNDPKADLADTQNRQMVEEANRQAGFKVTGNRGGKAPIQGLKGFKGPTPPNPPETDDEAAERLERMREERLSDDEEEEEDEEGEEQYDYGYNPLDDPDSVEYKRYAERNPSIQGGKTPATATYDDDAEEEEEEDEEEGSEESDEEEGAPDFDEDERLLKQRLDTVQDALDHFKDMSHQTIKNAEACHDKAKRLVEVLQNSQGIPQAVLDLANDVLGTSAQTIVDAYSTEEMVERAVDNTEPAVDRLAAGRTYWFQRRLELHDARVDNAQGAIGEIQRENASVGDFF